MLRGTIVEHAPASHVLIVLATGERRRVPIANVAWAGPVTEMSAPQPTTRATHAAEQTYEIRFTSELERTTTIHWRDVARFRMSGTVDGQQASASGTVGSWRDVCTSCLHAITQRTK